MSKKARAYTVQRLNGNNQNEAANRSGTSLSYATVITKKPKPRETLEAFQDRLRNFWFDAVDKHTDEPIKWADKMRASDLLGHHLGMFEANASGNTYNTIIMADNKSSDEATLLRKLEELRVKGLDKPQTPSNDVQ